MSQFLKVLSSFCHLCPIGSALLENPHTGGHCSSPIIKMKKLGFESNHHTIWDKEKLCWLDISLELCAQFLLKGSIRQPRSLNESTAAQSISPLFSALCRPASAGAVHIYFYAVSVSVRWPCLTEHTQSSQRGRSFADREGKQNREDPFEIP